MLDNRIVETIRKETWKNIVRAVAMLSQGRSIQDVVDETQLPWEDVSELYQTMFKEK